TATWVGGPNIGTRYLPGTYRVPKLALELKRQAEAVFVLEVKAEEVGVIKLKFAPAEAETHRGAGGLLVAGSGRGAVFTSPDLEAGGQPCFLRALHLEHLIGVEIEIDRNAQRLLQYDRKARAEAHRHLIGSVRRARHD